MPPAQPPELLHGRNAKSLPSADPPAALPGLSPEPRGTQPSVLSLSHPKASGPPENRSARKEGAGECRPTGGALCHRDVLARTLLGSAVDTGLCLSLAARLDFQFQSVFYSELQRGLVGRGGGFCKWRLQPHPRRFGQVVAGLVRTRAQAPASREENPFPGPRCALPRCLTRLELDSGLPLLCLGHPLDCCACDLDNRSGC